MGAGGLASPLPTRYATTTHHFRGSMRPRAGFSTAELLNLVVLAAILAAIILGRQQQPRLGGAVDAPTAAPAQAAPAQAAPPSSRCTAITPLDSIRIAADTLCRQIIAAPPSNAPAR